MQRSEQEDNQEWLYGQQELYSIWINNERTSGEWQILADEYVTESMDKMGKPFLSSLDTCKALMPFVKSKDGYDTSKYRIAKISRFMVDGKHIPTHILKVYE